MGQNLQFILPLSYGNNYVYVDKSLAKYVVRDRSHSHNSIDYDRVVSRERNKYEITKASLGRIQFKDVKEFDYYENLARQQCLENLLNFCFYNNIRDNYKKIFNARRRIYGVKAIHLLQYIFMESNILNRILLKKRKKQIRK